MEWYWNLAALLLDENKAKTSLSELRHELEKHIVQLYSKILDYQMSSIARYGRHRVTVLARDGIKLDDWASRIEDIKAAETAVETAMAQYNTREIILELQEFADSAKRMEATLANISSAIQDQTRQQAKWRDDDKYKDFMRNLYATDPREDKKRIEVTKGTLIPGSFNWILQNDEYQKWQTDPQSSLLWIKGHPGKGKTMLMCGVVDALAQTNKTLAYFFCQATEARLNNATAVLRGLLYLLVDQRPQLFSHLRERYEKSGDTLFQDTNSWYALDGMFQKAVDSEDLETTFIVIDALDECVLDLQMLLDFIVRHSGSNPHIKWIVSGRDWEEIAEGLAKAKQKVRLELELNQDSISKAVDHFIDVKVDELDEVKIYGQDLKESVRQRLKENAQGTFLWAALVCQELAGLGVRKRHTLQLLDSIPSGLDSLYRRMWEKMDSSRDAALCQEILAIVLVVYRPITLNELRGLSQSFEDFDLEEMEEVVRGCGSFLTIVGSTIYFVHLSAKDFLLKEPELALSRGIAYYHHAVFARSLQVLSTTLERDICRLGSPGISSFDIEHSQTKPLWRIHYACAYWIDHLAKSTPEKVREALQDQGNVHIFMRTKFLYWLEALSIKDEVSGTFKSMEGLEEKAVSSFRDICTV